MIEIASNRIRLQPYREPEWHFTGFEEIIPDLFRHAGVEHVLLDLDGCMTPANKHDQIDPHARRVIDLMKRQFHTINLATNNENELGRLCIDLGLDHLFSPWDDEEFLGYKPRPRFFNRILADLQVEDPSTIVLIGDDPIRDVSGAHFIGMQAALVDCLDPDGFFNGDLYLARSASE
jgi:FMN phosphatase YigB (HAD superfamily)